MSLALARCGVRRLSPIARQLSTLRGPAWRSGATPAIESGTPISKAQQLRARFSAYAGYALFGTFVAAAGWTAYEYGRTMMGSERLRDESFRMVEADARVGRLVGLPLLVPGARGRRSHVPMKEREYTKVVTALWYSCSSA